MRHTFPGIHNEINGGEPFSDFEPSDDFDIDRAVLVAPVTQNALFGRYFRSGCEV